MKRAGAPALVAFAAALAACAAKPPPVPPDAGDVGAPKARAPVPFGSHGSTYAPGAILPTGARRDHDATVARIYDRWKAAYLTAGCGGNFVKTSGGTGAKDAITVSEGHGYGMIVTALMMGHDPDARATFDGFVRVLRKFPSSGNRDLMAWAVGEGCVPTGGANSATDGDLDVAFALLLAHRQWGSKGAIDYFGEARKVIAAIARSDINATTSLPLLGDWATGAAYFYATRPSDFMPDHFRAFAEVGPRATFEAAIDRSYRVVEQLQAGGGTTGLVPDFVIDTDKNARAAPPNFLEVANDGDYYFNACRVPWRLATDYVISGDERARRALRMMNSWIVGATAGDPRRITAGYTLDGRTIERENTAAFVAPFAVAAMVDPTNQPWLDALWRWMSESPAEDYYADSIRLLAMLVVSGNWVAP